MLLPKKPQHRDKKWLLSLRSQPCVYTGSSEVEAAHVRLGSHSGLAQKPDDFCAVSLNCHLHRAQHQHGEMSFHLKMVNEYPMALMDFIRAFAKLRYLGYLVSEGRDTEAVTLLRD